MRQIINFSCLALEWTLRFIRGSQVFGLMGAWQVFVRSNRKMTGERRGVITKVILDGERPFYFRRGIDYGVLSNFYEKGFFINNNGGPTINKVLDAGANIGDETARFFMLYPGIKIISLEAEKNNFDVLKKNFSDVQSVKLIYGAIWHESGYLNLLNEDNASSESFRVDGINKNYEVEKVKAYTVSDILKKANWDEIDIFKIDIEGAEHELFRYNFDEWIGLVKCFVIETHDRFKPETTQYIFKAITANKFNSYLCGENLVLIKSDLPWTLEKKYIFQN